MPSSTETLLALGANVIACTRFCEQPELNHVGGTKNPDVDAIVALMPDLVVLDREENRVEDHDALMAAGIEVFVSDVTDVEAGLTVVDDLAALARVDAPLLTPPGASAAGRRSAFVPIWRRPWMTISADTYGASVLSWIGLDVVDVGGDSAYPTVELDEIAAVRPDVIAVPSEPYEFSSDHVRELQLACPTSSVVEVDGQDLFWWGMRTPDALTRLAAALAPPTML
ncbi:MAG: helical backbone metal receptor [Ilumatobacter sp.]